jgi:predicted RNA-binding protein Jag
MTEALSVAPQIATEGALPDRQGRVAEVLGGIRQRMNFPATFEFNDLSDGSLGVAVHFSEALPGITPGKRSHLVDSLQFLLNKVINRPNLPRRWISLGVNGFPEPRAAKPDPQQPKSAPVGAKLVPSSSAASASTPTSLAPRSHKNVSGKSAAPQTSAQRVSTPMAATTTENRALNEREMNPPPNAAFTRLATALASKAAQLGRVYAVLGLSSENRARFLKATAGVRGVSVRTEGEGHWRRLVFVPDRLTPVSKKTVMPDYSEDE